MPEGGSNRTGGKRTANAVTQRAGVRRCATRFIVERGTARTRGQGPKATPSVK